MKIQDKSKEGYFCNLIVHEAFFSKTENLKTTKKVSQFDNKFLKLSVEQTML